MLIFDSWGHPCKDAQVPATSPTHPPASTLCVLSLLWSLVSSGSWKDLPPLFWEDSKLAEAAVRHSQV